MSKAQEIRTAIAKTDELWRFDGQMVAECPFTEQIGFCRVLAFPEDSPTQYAGQTVYVSDAGIEHLKDNGVGVVNHQDSFTEYVDES